MFVILSNLESNLFGKTCLKWTDIYGVIMLLENIGNFKMDYFNS